MTFEENNEEYQIEFVNGFKVNCKSFEPSIIESPIEYQVEHENVYKIHCDNCVHNENCWNEEMRKNPNLIYDRCRILEYIKEAKDFD